MLSYLKWVINNWKYYKSIKQQKIPLWNKKLPSQTYFKYPPNSTFEGRKVLNLGCGLSVYKAPNVTNLDYAMNDGINVVHDLSTTPLPFEDESFDYIIANHVLEHIPSWFECFKETCRILKPNGTIEIWVPPISSDSAFSFRDHINRIGTESFTGVGRFRRGGTNLMAENECKEISPVASVDMTWRGYRAILTWWILFLPESIVEWMACHLRNIVSEEGFKFTKVVDPCKK